MCRVDDAARGAGVGDERARPLREVLRDDERMAAGAVEGVIKGVLLLVLLALGEGLHGSTGMMSGVPVHVSAGIVFISPHDAVIVVGGGDRAEACRLPARQRGAHPTSGHHLARPL